MVRLRTCLVTGASGLLGSAVVPCLSQTCRVVGVGHRHPGRAHRAVDLRDPAALRALLEDVRPDVVVHGAAYRDPDFCEEHREETWRLNVHAVRVLCEVLPDEVPLLFVSSDYVFDGKHPPYHEESARRPVNAYGESKVEGEDLALARRLGLVLRIPLLVGAGPSLDRSGLITQMREEVLSGQPKQLDDVILRFPTWTRDVAGAMAFLLARGARGVYHFSGPEGRTRYGWALEMARLLGAGSQHLQASSRVIPRRAVRPPNSQLAAEKIRREGYSRLTPFEEVVAAVLASFA